MFPNSPGLRWLKRLGLVLVLSTVGYILLMDAAVSTDQKEYVAWYYKIEFTLAAAIWWPASMYMKARELYGHPVAEYGYELLLYQLMGYLAAYGLYDFYKKT